jgi:signal transduction histidine kinase
MVFDEGEPVELVSVGRDVTESREAQERIAAQARELALRNDALEQFGGIVSHDLKAPLRQVRQLSEMIKEDIELGKTEDLPTWSTNVVERSRSMERMISSLFAYSRLAYQGVVPEFQAFGCGLGGVGRTWRFRLRSLGPNSSMSRIW